MKCYDCGNELGPIFCHTQILDKMELVDLCVPCFRARGKAGNVASYPKPKGHSYTTTIEDDVGVWPARIVPELTITGNLTGSCIIDFAPSGQKGFTMNLFEYAVVRVVENKKAKIVINTTLVPAKCDADVRVLAGIDIGQRKLPDPEELVVHVRPFGG